MQTEARATHMIYAVFCLASPGALWLYSLGRDHLAGRIYGRLQAFVKFGKIAVPMRGEGIPLSLE